MAWHKKKEKEEPVEVKDAEAQKSEGDIQKEINELFQKMEALKQQKQAQDVPPAQPTHAAPQQQQEISDPRIKQFQEAYGTIYDHGAFIQPGYGEMCNLLFGIFTELKAMRQAIENNK